MFTPSNDIELNLKKVQSNLQSLHKIKIGKLERTISNLENDLKQQFSTSSLDHLYKKMYSSGKVIIETRINGSKRIKMTNLAQRLEY